MCNVWNQKRRCLHFCELRQQQLSTFHTTCLLQDDDVLSLRCMLVKCWVKCENWGTYCAYKCHLLQSRLPGWRVFCFLLRVSWVCSDEIVELNLLLPFVPLASITSRLSRMDFFILFSVECQLSWQWWMMDIDLLFSNVPLAWIAYNEDGEWIFLGPGLH